MNIDMTVKEMFLRASMLRETDPELADYLEKTAGEIEAELNQLYEKLDSMADELS